MAGEHVYVGKLGAWTARGLGATGDFGVGLDTEGLGYQMPGAVANDPTVTAAGHALAAAAGVLRGAGSELDTAVQSGDDSALARAFGRLFEGLHQYVDAAKDLQDRIDARAATLPAAERAATQAFATLLGRRLIDFFVVTALDRELPRLSFLLKLLGLVERRALPASGEINEPNYVRSELRLERIKDLFDDPPAHFANVYGWGTADFDPTPVFRSVLAFYRPESSIDVGMAGPDAFFQVGALRWSRDSSVTPPGLKLEVSAASSQTFRERVETSPAWGIDAQTDLMVTGGIDFRLRPPFVLSAEPRQGTAGGAASAVLNRNESARGLAIIGGNDLLRLSADNVGVGAELAIGASTSGHVDINPGVLAELKRLTISLGSEGSDSFLASLLAGADVEGSFDLGLGWKLSEGLVIRAAGGVEIAIPMHQSVGVATFETLFIALRAQTGGALALEASASIRGQLGPLTAVVERIGVIAGVAFSSGAGEALGPVGLDLGFKPPNGVGLAIDAGVVRGGGYLSFDHEKGEYAGALELVFARFLALKAIGLISTRLPDGAPGFSLLVIITAEFGTPLQLGYGFTLHGVGGLLGLNRTLRLEELVAGVRTGSIDHVMFPRDVVENAPQIISDMRRFFPAQPGTFLIGPMAKLGWGTPTLVTASLGVVVEVPPGNIAILGVLEVALPDEDAALLVLKASFVGALEPDRSRLWFFASLFESRVLFMALDGEMGLLVAWGERPEFLISVGGFHPRFNPPPMPFPAPRRVSLSILDESFARVRVEGYFAVTSNTAQFGARAELFFGVSAFSLDGHIAFDALFQFSPFHFSIGFSASVGVRVFGVGVFSVRLRGELEGTSPWHVEGEGSISLLLWDISIPFSHTWGQALNTTLPDVAALAILQAELAKRENWTALAPAGARLLVSLRQLEPTEDLVLHPVGSLRVSQRALPLDLDIEKVGSRAVSDIRRARLSVTTPGLRRQADVKEPFATAQFRELDQAARLSAPGYEPQNAGIDVTVQGDDVATSHAVKRIVLQELILIDSNYQEYQALFFNRGLEFFELFLNANAAARSPLSATTKRMRQPFDEQIVASASGYVVASTATNGVAADATRFSSQAAAQDFLAGQAQANPALAAQLHVIPEVEAVPA